MKFLDARPLRGAILPSMCSGLGLERGERLIVDRRLTGSGRDSNGDVSIDQSLPPGWDSGSVGAIHHQYYYSLARVHSTKEIYYL